MTVIGARGGDEVRQMLEQMGEAGYGLVQSSPAPRTPSSRTSSPS
ncbi:hypothetical protein ACFQ60_22350 [Streptomyces zhihengii]